MRRRLLLVVLWLAGTAGATGVVSYAVTQLSSDLATVNANNNRDVFTPTTVSFPSGTTSVASVDSATSTEPPTTEASGVTAPAEVTTTTAPILDIEVASVPETTPTTRAPTTSTPTTRPNSGTTAPSPVPTRPAPVTTQPAPVTTAPQPPPPLTTPPTTPPTTVPPPPEVSCANDLWQVQRIGTVFYRACTDGIHFVTATVGSSAWSARATQAGPPTVSVRFTSTSGQTLTCVLTGDIGGVSSSGDC